MERARITFFMIAYNEEKYIGRAIQSFLNQTEPNIELYIRNNGSADRTGLIVQEYANNDSRIHLVENKDNWMKDNGTPFVNERGAIDIWPVNPETLGDYVAFLDADDQLDKDFAREMLRAADSHKADITVCGHWFMAGGTTMIGDRMPPSVQFGSQQEMGAALRKEEVFVQLYNVFRTYWGKLFCREFFLQHYDEAWERIGGQYGIWLDTVVMLRYLMQCERLSCVTKHLYSFTVSASTSTYSTFPSFQAIGRALQAEALFDAGQGFLQKVGAVTGENVQFLYQLNLAFCWEAMEGLIRLENLKPDDLNRVSILLNNRICGQYIRSSSETVYRRIEPSLRYAWENCRHSGELYLKYPIRMLYTRKLMETHPDAVILPPLVLGILCDPENQHQFGWDLLEKLQSRYPFLLESGLYQYMRDWEVRHGSLFNWWVWQVRRLESKEEIGNLPERLKSAYDREDYAEASNLLSELSQLSPLHRDALFYRIQLLELIGDHEPAAMLAASARILYGEDVELQAVCWYILAQEGERA